MDCGPTCLRMIARFYGKRFSLNRLRDLSELGRLGVSMLGISEAAEKIGFRSLGVKLEISKLREAALPCILHWDQRHFVVLYKVRGKYFFVADPAKGLIRYKESELADKWIQKKSFSFGFALLVSPTPAFFNEDNDEVSGLTWTFLWQYRRSYSSLFFQLFVGLAVASILQLLTPFLTQAIVDIGINAGDIKFVYIILVSQIMLFLGTTSVDFVRSWIMLHITSRLNVAILTDFLSKLMRLPMRFFDTRMTGDIMQRMNDHSRIENFLTGTTLTTVFSIVNLFVFTFAVAYYSVSILLVFLISTILYGAWIVVFMKSRRQLDQKRFDISSTNQTHLVELINGMQEIKLQNCERQKRWKWENIQAKLFKFSVRSLALTQYQQGGSLFITQGKNIIITFISAKAVIDGNLTLGGMMAVQYMAGQLNSPIEQLLGLIQGYQDAKISLERLNEVHKMEDEESNSRHWDRKLPKDKSIQILNLVFRYPGSGNLPVLEGINLHIPEGKITAIVGMSGSGKTTILKLLLRFYECEKGTIKVGDAFLNNISFNEWRRHCGIVMQEGYIFSDTIAGNIAVGDDFINEEKLRNAIKIANIEEFIAELPMGLETRIGATGAGISQGQKQRILIARAVYKDPQYLFFDEATNSLDSKNERQIMENMNSFFKGRTVIVVAHRLSTVSNADNIVVLHKGSIVEQGTHLSLTLLRGEYYGLVKNQLELGE